MKLGSLSAKYELNGNPGTVSINWKSPGGIAYGHYRLSGAGGDGSVKEFIEWLKDRKHYCSIILEKHYPGSREFSAAWQFCANNYADFGDLQHDYIKDVCYQPAIAKLREAYFNIENHHEVMQDVVWSRAFQYGAEHIVKIFENACHGLGYPNLSYVDDKAFDEAMVRAVYLDVCKKPEWTNGPDLLQKNLCARFENECQDALERLG